MVKRKLNKAKNKFFRTKLGELRRDPRRFWNTINQVMHRTPCRVDPSPSVASLSQQFSTIVGIVEEPRQRGHGPIN